MNYLNEICEVVAAAVVAEAIVEALKFPVALIKRITDLRRVKPLDCGLCMAVWVGLVWHGPDLTLIAFTLLSRQIMHRLMLW